MNGPTSFITNRRIGEFGCAASSMPISPPMDVPTQSTLCAPLRAMSAAIAAQ